MAQFEVRALQLEETRGPINAARIGYLCHVHVGAEGSAKGLCKKLLIRILPGNFLESEGGGRRGVQKSFPWTDPITDIFGSIGPSSAARDPSAAATYFDHVFFY